MTFLGYSYSLKTGLEYSKSSERYQSISPPHIGHFGGYSNFVCSTYPQYQQNQMLHFGQCLKPPPIGLPHASQGLAKRSVIIPTLPEASLQLGPSKF
jgi:hypothetical protein